MRLLGHCPEDQQGFPEYPYFNASWGSRSTAVIGDSEATYAVVVLKNLRGEQPERQLPVLQLVALEKERLAMASPQR